MRSACTMIPGPLATYVRRWPRISASSRTPPSDTRWKGRLSARATDCPSEVLPTPGGPTNLTQTNKLRSATPQTRTIWRGVQEDRTLDAAPLGWCARPIGYARDSSRRRSLLTWHTGRHILLYGSRGRLDLALALRRECQLLESHDGEILDQPALDLLQPKVIRIELRARVRQELTVPERLVRCAVGRGRALPRKRRNPLKLSTRVRVRKAVQCNEKRLGRT